MAYLLQTGDQNQQLAIDCSTWIYGAGRTFKSVLEEGVCIHLAESSNILSELPTRPYCLDPLLPPKEPSQRQKWRNGLGFGSADFTFCLDCVLTVRSHFPGDDQNERSHSSRVCRPSIAMLGTQKLPDYKIIEYYIYPFQPQNGCSSSISDSTSRSGGTAPSLHNGKYAFGFCTGNGCQ